MARDKTISRTLPVAMLLLVSLGLSYWLFRYLRHNVAWDIGLHTQMLRTFLEHGSFPVPPGYPFMIWLFSAFSRQFQPLMNSANLVLALMTVLKLAILLFALKKTSQQLYPDGMNKNQQWVLVGLSVALMFVAPVYTFQGFFYFGRIALTIWHNPTTIMVTPFAILLFLATPAFLEKPKQNSWKIILLGLANIMIKPSFAFAYIPGVFAYAVLIGMPRRQLLQVFIPLLLLGLMIIAQYYMIYISGTLDALIYQEKTTGILLRPMLVWNHYLESGNINFWVSLATSMAFPLVFMILYARSGKITPLAWLGCCIMGFGLLFTLLLAEGGGRMYHGNFLWTAYLTNLTLFLAVFLNVFSLRSPANPLTWKEWLLYSVFALHVMSGIAFLINTMVIRNYL